MSSDTQNSNQDLVIGEQVMNDVADKVSNENVASSSGVQRVILNQPTSQPVVMDNDKIAQDYLKYYSIFASIPFVGLVVYIVDAKADALVKNFAKQSNFLMLLLVLSFAFLASPIAQVVYAIIWPLVLLLWILLVCNAKEGLNFQFPLIGKIFDNLFN